MKSIFFTKPKDVTFECLKFLVEQGEELLGVVIYDKSHYEGGKFFSYCKEKDIPIIDFAEVEETLKHRSEKIEMIYCNTFPKRLKAEWLALAQIAAINFHSAPLPDYRGVFAYNFAFLNGEKEFGVTCHYLDRNFDTGDIIEVSRFPYDFEHGNVAELVSLSNQYLYQLFCKTYLRFKNREVIVGVPQTGGHYYSRQDFENAKKIQPTDDIDMILKRVRAFWYPPYKGAYLELHGHKLYLVPDSLDRH